MKNLVVIWNWLPEFWLKSLKNFIRILWSSNYWKKSDQILLEFHKNSWIWKLRLATRILIEILKEFHKNSVVIYFLKNSDQILKEVDKNSVVIWTIGYYVWQQNSDQNHCLVFLDEFSSNPGRISQEFCGNLILEKFGSLLKLTTRILIEILEEFHKNSVVT